MTENARQTTSCLNSSRGSPSHAQLRVEPERKRKADVLQEVNPNIASMASPEKRRTRNQKREGGNNAAMSKDDGLIEHGPFGQATPRLRRPHVTPPQPPHKDAMTTNTPHRRTDEMGLCAVGDGREEGGRHQTPRPSAYAVALTDNTVLEGKFQTRSQSSANSRQRSKSPVKKMADLVLADKPILDVAFGNSLSQLPADIRELYKQLKRASDGEEVLPTAIKDEIDESAGDMELFRPYMFNDQHVANAETRMQMLRDLAEIVEICAASRKCSQDCVSEPAWNDEVHSRVLRLALRGVDGVECQNITTARPVPALIPRHVSGDSFKSKLVDYTINLIPDKEMELRIRKVLQHAAPGLQTINQTMYGPLRYRPSVVSVETKTPDASEQDARTQLAMWEVTYFNRMRLLVPEAATMISRPVLFASGSQWSILFANDRPDLTVILGKLLGGETTLVLGCYKVIAAIRCLCAWSKTDFKNWFMGSVQENCHD